MPTPKLLELVDKIRSKKYLEIKDPWFRYGILIVGKDQTTKNYEYEVKLQTEGWKEIS